MIAGTHIAFATTLYLGGAALFEYPVDLLGWALAAFASLLPDIDLPTSKFGRVCFWISTYLEKQHGHRTVTHSFIAIGVLALLASPLFFVVPVYFWCLVGGYWSHPWIDMLNIRGTDLLWPSPVRVVMPGNRNYRLEVGSKSEMILLTVLCVACLALYPLSGIGFRGGLQYAIGSFDIAREEFLEKAGTRWYQLELEAIDNLTLAHIRCQCPVLGTWQSGLIVLHEGRPRAVGKNPAQYNLHPTYARLIAEELLRVIAQKFVMNGRSLGWLLGKLDRRRVVYLSGEIQVGDKRELVEDIELYHPASFNGKVLRLHYARAEELGPYVELVAALGEIFVQVWLREGETAVEMREGKEGNREMVPTVLKEYL